MESGDVESGKRKKIEGDFNLSVISGYYKVVGLL